MKSSYAFALSIETQQQKKVWDWTENHSKLFYQNNLINEWEREKNFRLL
jgi:hypothetical protein